MEIILYSNKQILGGFVLIFLIGLLFVINLILSNNLSNSYQGMNISYFIGPLILTICMLSILYIASIKKSIQLTMDKYILPDNFTMINCPDEYDKQSYNGNIQCIPIDNSNETGTGTGTGTGTESGTGTGTESGTRTETGTTTGTTTGVVEGGDSTNIEELFTWPKKAFFLSGNNQFCGTSELIEQNGCFNKFPNRIEKCNKINNYLKDYQAVLNTWTDFQKECQT
jgi:hypothetical protein